jgi:hypothetical protein
MSAYRLPDGRQITGALTVRLGQQSRDGRWTKVPAAKYECLLCETTESVTGADAVTQFIQTIRTSHPVSCPGYPQHRDATAA